MATTSLVFLVAAAVSAPAPVAAEWFSDIGTGGSSSSTGDKALAARAEKFWSTVLSAAEKVDLNTYEDTLQAADKVIAQLPEENAEVRRLLRSSADRLRKASEALFLDAIFAGEAAGEKLSNGFLAPRRREEVAISAYGDVFGQAIRRFAAAESAAGGKETFEDEAFRQVAERQAEALPVLQRTAEISHNILEDCRLAKKEAFDALKYDVYVKGAPTTPKAADTLADRLVEAAAGIRHKFFELTMGEVEALVKDTEGQHDTAGKVLAVAAAAHAVDVAPEPEHALEPDALTIHASAVAVLSV